MATRHTLGVAASTLALAVSCIAGALPASASTSALLPQSVAITAAPNASALPSDAEVQEAKKDKASTNAMIARIEASLASSRAELQRVETEAAQAQESLLTAGEERDLRTAAAEKAVEQLEYAKTYLEQSRNDLGAIASDIYRNGAGTSTLSLLLDDNQEGDLFYKAATIDALSEQKVQSVNTATEAEGLVSAWQEYADAAQNAAEEAAANYDAAAATANSTLSTYEAAIAPEKQLRDDLIGHLATLKQKEESEVRQAVEEREAQEQEEALADAIAEEETAKVPEAKQDSIQPLSVEKPRELEQTEPEEETVKPKPEKVEEEPEAVQPPVAPKPEPIKKAEPKPEPTKKAEPKPEPTKKAEPKPKVTPKPTPKPEPKPEPKPKVTPKPTPKPEPKPAPKPEPKPEVAPQSSNNYSAAFSWALKTADDPSKYYVYGANGPDAFDCSSFSQRAFGKSGISLPRTSSQQFASAPQYVSLSNLRPGDLVFSSSNGGSSFYHVAIYIGNGQVVHARNPSVGISVTPLSYVNNLYPKAARY